MKEFLDSRREGSLIDIDMIIGRWIGDYPDADTFAHGMLHSHAGIIGGFCGSPALDRRVESGREESDPATRHAIYHEIEQTVTRDALLLPLFHEQSYRIARPEIEGLRLNLGFPEVPYEELRLRK
jgi:ABC-type oligopeptide transport system substrate-binding subunit